MGREQFSGPVSVTWSEDSPRDMQLLKDVTFTDSGGKIWRALQGSIINGASIPRFFWPLIGSPFVGFYRRATVLHDVYCDNHLRPAQDVHNMFFEAMISDGVPENKALKIFNAVDKFGPRW